jgi:hypothetical protein
MKYNTYEINDLSNLHVVNILKNGIQENMFESKQLAKNYCFNYRDDMGNLFYLLEHGRYKKGSYFVITDENDEYVASAGWNEHTEDTALLLTRIFLLPKYRAQQFAGNYFLPNMIKQTSHYKKLWITFNEYNKTIYHWFERSNKGKAPSLQYHWPDIYREFKPIGKKEVNNTLQYVVEFTNDI